MNQILVWGILSVKSCNSTPGTKYYLTFTRPSISPNKGIALTHTLPSLRLDLPVRADLDELGANLLDDGSVTNLLSLGAAVLPSQFDHADRECASQALEIFF